jgi:hypothetical protein
LEKRLIDLSDFILIRRSQVTGKLRRSRVPNILGFHNGVNDFLKFSVKFWSINHGGAGDLPKNHQELIVVGFRQKDQIRSISSRTLGQFIHINTALSATMIIFQTIKYIL